MTRAAEVDRALNNPHSVIEDLFKSHTGDRGSLDDAIQSHFSTLFQSDEAFSQIPMIDPRYEGFESLLQKENVLVRFRGMIQSTDTEIYESLQPGRKLGGWGIEYSDALPDTQVTLSASEQFGDRGLAWVVNVPGETPWRSSSLDGLIPVAHPPSNHRYTETIPDKFPYPNPLNFGIHAKIYPTTEGRVSLTEIHNFVGILSHEQLLTETPNADVLVPALHVVFSRPIKLGLDDFPYPMKPYPAPPNGEESATLQKEEGSSEPARVRSALIKWLAAEALGGDEFAAEWIVLSIISKIITRSPPVLPLTLTLGSVPLPPLGSSTSIPTLITALKLLLPAVNHMPLSIPLVNDSRMVPISQEEELLSGFLQLPQETCIVVTEADVAEGTVTERGLRNISALKQCASSQTIEYEYPYSSYTFKTSINFIVLAQGKKSPFLETDITIPLSEACRSPEKAATLYKTGDSIALPEEGVLESFRNLVCGAKLGKVDVAKEVLEYIQEDFVRERQRDTSVTSDDLLRQMSVARLLTLSLHEPSITRELWERGKMLDSERKSRQATE